VDPVSQAALGAAAAQAVAMSVHAHTRSHAAWAALLGGAAGAAPDLDVLVRSASDPLLFLEVHRQFTHALAFVPIGAALCALAALPLVRGRLAPRWVYAYCLVGFATHGLLDACTSYGTQLLWPFSDVRVAWNNVAVVDPLFTLPLLALVVLAALRGAPLLGHAACAWAVAYLLLGVVQRERAEVVALEVAAHRGHVPIQMQVKPAFGNLLLWKAVYAHGDRYHVDAVRAGWRPLAFPGASVPMLDRERDLPWLLDDSVQARDLERFRRYSAGFVALDPTRAHHVIDVRYSLVPNQIEALWGIRLDPDAGPDAHAAFYTSRAVSSEHRAEIVRLLVGRTDTHAP
jgi:inner membrane protein